MVANIGPILAPAFILLATTISSSLAGPAPIFGLGDSDPENSYAIVKYRVDDDWLRSKYTIELERVRENNRRPDSLKYEGNVGFNRELTLSDIEVIEGPPDTVCGFHNPLAKEPSPTVWRRQGAEGPVELVRYLWCGTNMEPDEWN